VLDRQNARNTYICGRGAAKLFGCCGRRGDQAVTVAGRPNSPPHEMRPRFGDVRDDVRYGFRYTLARSTAPPLEVPHLLRVVFLRCFFTDLFCATLFPSYTGISLRDLFIKFNGPSFIVNVQILGRWPPFCVSFCTKISFAVGSYYGAWHLLAAVRFSSVCTVLWLRYLFTEHSDIQMRSLQL
jgi:hypothetical protein